MATISENLQIIKTSIEDIKQAIIDKGGDVSGDISTWADAISGISGGGESGTEPIKFYCTASIDSSGTATYTGSFENIDFLESFNGYGRLFIVYHAMNSIAGSCMIHNNNFSDIQISLYNVYEQTGDPLGSQYLYNLTAMIGPTGYYSTTKYICLPVELVPKTGAAD